jgi:crotonobetainyl-CoA:carnitine CoA-transferase CaiB-like acyl-CoA transferase
MTQSHRNGTEQSARVALDALKALWSQFGLPAEALAHLTLTAGETGLPSSFAVGAASQASIAAAALAAAEIWQRRSGERQHISVDMRDAALECTAYFSLDGRVPDVWDKFSGLYRCGVDDAPDWVRIHANFAHHRDGALRLLGFRSADGVERADVERALQSWSAEGFEDAAAEAGLVVAAARSFAQWDAHPQGIAVANLPLMSIEKIGEAPPIEWPRLSPDGLPLEGIRVLDLTRILAGPIAGRTLAAYGADVMLVNSPNLPNIESIADTSRGKLSAHVDLHTDIGKAQLRRLVEGAHVFVQAYRPGGLQALGFGAEDVARIRLGTVHVSLSAYGHEGPWAERRGFDSLVQTATGFNRAEAEAFNTKTPKALPMQILDYASGFLMAFGAAAALLRQYTEGGSWHVRVSLAQTAHWLRGQGRTVPDLAAPRPDFKALVQDYPSGFGRLEAMPHAARFSLTPPRWARPSMPPGTHPPAWPEG